MNAARDKIQDWFYEYLKEKGMKGGDFFIEEIVIDVFGFSRGAATARTFIDYMQTGKRTLISVFSMRNGKKIKSKVVETPSLTKHISNHCDIDTSQAKIIIDFASLFDTVSAHNFALLSDVEKLKLDEVKQARFTYHLASSEEYRGCFR